MYYYTTLASAALHRAVLASLGNDRVVAQNGASALFCTAFVALGVANRPRLLATSMLGYLLSDSASMATGRFPFSWEYLAHHGLAGALLLTSLSANGAYNDLTVVLGGTGRPRPSCCAS